MKLTILDPGHRDLHDAVLLGPEAGRLEVDHDVGDRCQFVSGTGQLRVPEKASFHGGPFCVAHAWMRKFRLGPVEWLWRTLTYGRLQTLRRSQDRTAGAGSVNT